jgi:thioredoxin 1
LPVALAGQEYVEAGGRWTPAGESSVRGGGGAQGPSPDRTDDMTKAAAVTDATFDNEVLKSSTPVLVDFWAEWCGPCKMISPVLEEIADEHKGKLTIAKLNVDENPDVAMRYGVMSIPTLALFIGGVEKKRLIGAMPKRNIVNELSEFIS